MSQLKTCTSCGFEKVLSCYHKFPSGKYGVRPKCKECRKIESSEYYRKQKDRILARNKKWSKENPGKEFARHKKWRSANIERSRKSGRDHQRRRRLTVKGKLEAAMSTAFRRSIVRGAKFGRRTAILLGYSVDQLKAHLERCFLPGMSWSNYGRYGWEIDHKVPLSAHNYETPYDIDFKRAWALSNLQPLWMSDNRSKHAKLEKPFQPSLALAVNDNQQNIKDATKWPN